MKQEVNIETNSSGSQLTITLSSPPNKRCNVNIYNVAGEKVKQIAINKQNTELNIESFTPGLYVLILSTGKKIHAFRFHKN